MLPKDLKALDSDIQIAWEDYFRYFLLPVL
jgi:hypothetical protein